MKLIRITSILTCLFATTAGLRADINAEREEVATKVASQWLPLVDEGKVAESWNAAGPYLQRAVSKEAWEAQLGVMRKPLGAMVSRHPRGATFKKREGMVPDGDYVTVTFETSFTNKDKAVETVNVVLQPDGSWKVSGYHIQ